jgi:hypothetical protein
LHDRNVGYFTGPRIDPNQQYIALESERHARYPELLVMSMIRLFAGDEEFILTTEGHRPDDLVASSKPCGAESRRLN